MFDILVQITFQGRAIRVCDELKILIEFLAFVGCGKIGAEKKNQFIDHLGIPQNRGFKVSVNDAIQVSSVYNFFPFCIPLFQNGITDRMKGRNRTRDTQIVIDAFAKLFDRLVRKRNNQNPVRLDTALLNEITHLGRNRSRLSGTSTGNHQRIILFRQYNLPLFPVERDRGITRLENVIEIGLLRSKTPGNVLVVMLLDDRRLFRKVFDSAECFQKIPDLRFIKLVLSDILVQHTGFSQHFVKTPKASVGIQ